MDGNDTPSALDAKLFEEGGGDDGVARREGVRVKESTSNHTHDHNAEASAEDGGAVANDGSAGDGTEVSHDLGDRDGIGGEVVLIREHGGVEILRAVGHEVEAGHEKDHVDEQKPMVLESYIGLLQESLAST